MCPHSLLTLETAVRVESYQGAVIKHSPQHNGSLPTHALTLGELAHNITPAGGRELKEKQGSGLLELGRVRICNITPGLQEDVTGKAV